MNIDLGSPIIDVAIGLSFVFFLLSVIASAVSEFGAGLFNLRGKTLLKGIEGMLGDVDLAREVLEHPLVRTNGRKEVRGELTKSEQESLSLWGRFRRLERKPSYVSASNFARALLSLTQDKKPKDDKELEDSSAKFMWEQFDVLGVKNVEDSAKKDMAKVEKWFDDSMERVGGWYKRYSQYLTIAIAIAVAVGLNANTLRIAERLDQEPATRAAVVAGAEKALENGRQTEEEKAEEEGKTLTAQEQIKGAGESFAKATGEVTALKLPFLWGADNDPGTMSVLDNILGWLLTVIAISLGAPFWFDALGKLSNLRMAGKKPEEGSLPAQAAKAAKAAN